MNRGRIQAQGTNTEKSESWATQQDVTKSDGIEKVDGLENQLTRPELRDRVESLADVRSIIYRCPPYGISPMKKTYYDDKENRVERVDLEILKGVAFINDPNND